MQYSFLKSCLVALAVVSGVVADATPGFDVFTQPLTPGSSIPAGSTYTIKWTPSSPAGKVSIVLLQGSSNITLQLGPTIASAIDSTTGSYDWKVPSSMTPVFALYGLKIQLDSDPTIYQYSTYFSISGLTTASVSASTTVTVVVSSVSGAVTTDTSTLSASVVTSANGTSGAATSTAGIYSNTTMTTKTTAGATGAAGTVSSTSSSATASKSSAAGNIAIGGTGLLGAMMVALGMLL